MYSEESIANGGSENRAFAVGVVLDDEDESADNTSGLDLDLGLSKRWGNQDSDWPVVAAASSSRSFGGSGVDEDGDWSAKMDDDVKQYLWDIPAESSVYDNKQARDSQERMELTQKRAISENSLMNKGGSSFTSNSGSVPGAYEVRDRIGGVLFGRATVQNANNDDDDHSHYSDFELFDTHYSRWRIAACLVCVIVVGLAVGLGIVLLAPDSEGIGFDEEFGRGAGGAQCAYADVVQPDPFLQCACTDNITVITDELLSRYQDLRQGFLPLVLPDVEESKKDTDNPASCEPFNVALMWLAMDSLGRSDDFNVMINRYALAILYQEWDGPKWENNEGWLSSEEQECNWYGVHCKRPFTVSGLDLSDNYLKGTIPSEISMLKDLVKIDLSENDMEGTIPDQLYTITTLEDLILWSNEFEGTIGTSIGNLTNLKELLLDNNHFIGTLPSELTYLDKMIWFMVDMNEFTGEIFDFALSWPDLVGFTVGGNAFNGTIPELFGVLEASLRVLDVSGTEVTGTLPSELGMLEEIEDFSADGHNFVGTIPTEILGNWRNLKNFALTFGNLEGQIPTEVGQLKFLEKMYLSENMLTGTIPTEFGLCTNLRDLDLGSNDIAGQVPTELGALSQLQSFNIGLTIVTGPAPSEVCILHRDVGGGDLVTFFAPCFDFRCDPSACCVNCCTAGCG